MSAETQDLSGTVVAITGATAGIGAAAARLLVGAGANVALNGRRQERLDELVTELGADRVVAVVGDVRRPEDNAALVNAALERWGRLDSIVPNAGIGMYGGILDYTDDEIARMIDTNFTGTVWSVRAAVPAMLETTGGGDVVIVASVAGLRGGGDEAVYAATKFAQVGLAGALDRELRERGVRVTAVCPAGVETEFAIGAGRTAGDPSLEAYLRPEDVAHAVVTVLQQPRRVRTTLWALWSMGQQS
ncbi:MAG: SDR family oxidoreductase [Actinomycetota bacterium]|nr:SDR family oxidoreductase [Actinomycetota bacterium]MDH4352540.1 SDR family oxidoreductase [Actinomycetota bacterium]